MDDRRRRRRSRRLTLAALAALVLLPPDASAQSFETVGVRAQGMGGAFVAVADDATATWWNPAGLAAGAFANLVLDYNETDDAPTNPVSRGIAFGYPALGLSYYRLPVNQFRVLSSTAGSVIGREDQGVLTQFGTSVSQSLGRHFVLGTTVKLMHAAETETDFDVGAAFSYGVLRVGATVRNLRAATLATDAGNVLQLERQARVGAALMGHTKGQIETATLSFDADLRTFHTLYGEERRAAGGAEIWTKGRVFGVRGGISANTVGDSYVSASGGASVALHHGIYIEGQITRGSDQSRQGWSAGLRLTF
ncbi:MAG TPA: hypothetical protein VKH42_08085 [Vicinamibacterales bacterium]|nr:hypothetical protein [Vicinamibacterales bacterium]